MIFLLQYLHDKKVNKLIELFFRLGHRVLVPLALTNSLLLQISAVFGLWALV